MLPLFFHTFGRPCVMCGIVMDVRFESDAPGWRPLMPNGCVALPEFYVALFCALANFFLAMPAKADSYP